MDSSNRSDRLAYILGHDVPKTELTPDEAGEMFNYCVQRLKPHLENVTPHNLVQAVGISGLSRPMYEQLEQEGAVQYVLPIKADDRMLELSSIDRAEKDPDSRVQDYAWMLLTREGLLVHYTCSFECLDPHDEAGFEGPRHRLLHAEAQELSEAKLAAILASCTWLPVAMMRSFAIQQGVNELPKARERIRSRQALVTEFEGIVKRCGM